MTTAPDALDTAADTMDGPAPIGRRPTRSEVAAYLRRLAADIREINIHRSRRFHLQRDKDLSGVSGTGTVAEGVRFPDGTVAIHWHGDHPSTVVWPSLEDAEAVHGHGGATRIVWDD